MRRRRHQRKSGTWRSVKTSSVIGEAAANSSARLALSRFRGGDVDAGRDEAKEAARLVGAARMLATTAGARGPAEASSCPTSSDLSGVERKFRPSWF